MSSFYRFSFAVLALLFIIGTTHSLDSTNSKEVNNELFIYHLTLTNDYNDPAKWTEETMTVINAHGDFLIELGKKGILGFAGRTKFEPGHENLFGIAVIRASSLEEAKEIMSADPAVKENIQQAQIFPFSMGIRFLDNFED